MTLVPGRSGVGEDTEEAEMTDKTTREHDEAREKLERALAERAAMHDIRLPGLGALPTADPSARLPSAARLRSPVPHHVPAA
ncbi:hypothetical protein ODJ79_23125 [Actinoplanes sp. KI2]|uniref:hypothetical protein n=1 Tax=Actinoplanes sp. KI2 TaxID=2983315 RepID=UPI0021D5E3D2|nr:hypothetical protein [Actinoplanes sp. KI2]MCU7726635.1 hypothetical protein [Actinoplanes sp. KI2]